MKDNFDFQSFSLYCQQDYIDLIIKLHNEDKNSVDAVSCMILIYVYLEKQYKELIKYKGIIPSTKICLNAIYYLHIIWGVLFHNIQLIFNQFSVLNDLIDEKELNIGKSDFLITKDLYEVSKISENYIYDSNIKIIKEDFLQISDKVWEILNKYLDGNYKYKLGQPTQNFETVLLAIKSKIKDKPLE